MSLITITFGNKTPRPQKTEAELAAERAAARPAPWDRPANLLLLAVWFGVMMGTVEMVLLKVLHWLERCPLDQVSPYLWTTPITDALLMAIPGIVIWLLARSNILFPRFRRVTLLLGLITFTSILIASMSSLMVRLFPPASVLLAAGLAFQFARFAEKHPKGIHRFAVSSIAVILGYCVIAGTISVIRPAMAEKRALANLQAAPAGAPNILLLVLDTVRAKNLSLYGHSRATTPNLQRWATNGTVFDRALSTSPFTTPAHASFFTGRYPHEMTVDFCAPLSPVYPTLAEVLQAKGYVTAAFTANIYSTGRQTGLDRGFIHFEAHTLNADEFIDRSSFARFVMGTPPFRDARRFYDARWGRWPASMVNRRFLHWLSQPRERPYFAFLNYSDAHAPYLPSTTFDNPDEPTSLDVKRRALRWCGESFISREDAAAACSANLDLYDACIRELDDAIQFLRTELEQQDDFDRTLIVVVGDHGEQFGEHGLYQHANSLYRQNLLVPLAVIDPRHPTPGKRVASMVSLRDLPSTLLDLVGIPPGGIAGESFASLIRSETNSPAGPSGPKYAFITPGPNFPPWMPNSGSSLMGVYYDDKFYIKGKKKEELFDFINDPDEKTNLVRSSESASSLDRYRKFAAEQRNLKRQ